MESQEVEYIWSQSDALNEWVIAYNEPRQKKIVWTTIWAIVSFAVAYGVWQVLTHSPELTAQIITRLIIICVFLTAAIVSSESYLQWRYRTYGVEYKITSAGICIKWSNKKWTRWTTTTLLWTSFTFYTVYSIDKAGNFYTFVLTTHEGRRCGIYADRKQVPFIDEMLAQHDLVKTSL